LLGLVDQKVPFMVSLVQEESTRIRERVNYLRRIYIPQKVDPLDFTLPLV
jgi:hypothetical protein